MNIKDIKWLTFSARKDLRNQLFKIFNLLSEQKEVIWWNLIWILRLVRQAVVMAFGPPALLSVWWYLWQPG